MQLMIDNESVQVELPEEIEEIARIIGDDEKTTQLLRLFEGESVYFPLKVSRVIELKRLQKEYVVLNKLPNLSQNKIFEILAARYGKSKRWIRELITRSSAA